MKSIAVLISGRGSNLQALLDSARLESWPARFAVISSRPDAPGVALARAAGVALEVIDSGAFSRREAFDAALLERVASYQPDLIVLAGFMRILCPEFVGRYSGRILNIHPSLLPAFRGLRTHRQALAAGVRVHGATVHFVTPELDHGPIVAQAVVRVAPDDTEASLEERVLVEEHRLYPRVVGWFLEGAVALEGTTVRLSGVASEELVLLPRQQRS
ncbi:MAG: phosphoribosylglycinamide formyltransferase [Burkholderiaceae bacterium]